MIVSAIAHWIIKHKGAWALHQGAHQFDQSPIPKRDLSKIEGISGGFDQLQLFTPRKQERSEKKNDPDGILKNVAPKIGGDRTVPERDPIECVDRIDDARTWCNGAAITIEHGPQQKEYGPNCQRD